MKKRKHRGIKAIILIIIILAVVFLIRDSRYNVELTEYNVQSDRLSESFDGFKIVQLSDLHGSDFNGELSALVARQSPDIIVLTGDFISEAEDLPAADALLSELEGIADIYFVSGNHDFASGEIASLTDILDRHGVKYLHNQYEVIEKNDESMILAGVEDPNSWADMPSPDELVSELRASYPDTYTVLLGHRNYWVTEYPALDVDLILCGHAHGGIIRLPGIGGLLGTDRSFLPDYEAGEFNGEHYTMIVSRGLGNSIPVPRILNRPEIVAVTLRTK